jgi:hypothetical protein
MQMSDAMAGRALVLGLSVLGGAMLPASTGAQGQGAPAQSEERRTPVPKPAPSKAAPAPSQDKAAPAPEQTQGKDEPAVVAADKLPKDIRTLHICAAAGDQVELSQERYAKSVLFFVTCPAARGALTPLVVYVARDASGRGAKRVKFELLAADGTTTTRDTVFSAVPAREAYTETGDVQPHTRTRNDPPWISGAWRPDDRPGVCAVAANWRLQGEKAELWFWEEAKDCPQNALPKYESRVDKKPPPLVGR